MVCDVCSVEPIPKVPTYLHVPPLPTYASTKFLHVPKPIRATTRLTLLLHPISTVTTIIPDRIITLQFPTARLWYLVSCSLRHDLFQLTDSHV